MDNSSSSDTGLQNIAGQQAVSDISSARPQSPAQFAGEAQQVTQYPGGVSYSPSPGGAQVPSPTVRPAREQDKDERSPAAPPRTHFSPLTRILMVMSVVVLLGGTVAVGGFMIWRSRQPAASNSSALNSPAASFDIQQVALNQLSASSLPTIQGSRKLNINGQLEISNSLIISPTASPINPVVGQIYYDNGSNVLKYFNGADFVSLQAQQTQPAQQTQQTTTPTIQSVNGTSGQLTLGDGLDLTSSILSNTGVLSVQGQTGAVTLTGGNGITINGTNISNSGVLNVTSGSSNVSVTNDGAGNVTIGVTSGAGTVTSSGGTTGTLPLFTGTQNIESSIIAQSGLTVTITGDLSVVTGGLSLSNALTVSNGGTGVQSLAGNGVLVGNGTAPLSSVTAGSAGLCLLSTAGAPTWSVCPSGGGVASLNGLTGGLSLSNASGSGSTITIDNASTVSKGIASFNATNFAISSGAVNTVQSINTGATPTFAGVNTNTITPSGTLTIGGTGQAFTVQGNASSVLTATSGGGTTTVAFVSPTANVTYRLQSASAGTYDICTSVGNCAGAGGGVSTSGGTTNHLAKFTGAQTVADSIITDNGSTVTVTGVLAVTNNGTFSGDVAVNGGDITSTGGLTIMPTGTLTLGSTGQQLALQGNGSTTLSATSSGLATTVTFQVPTANVTYRVPTSSAGTYDFCTTAGNCVGTGGGVSTSGGTVNRLAKFGGTQTIDNSSITDDGTTVTTTADLIVQGGSTTIGIASSRTGSLSFAHSGSSFLGTVIQGALSADRTYTLPDADGTVCLSSGNCSGTGSANTLQAAYDAGSTITTTTAKNIAFTLADTAADSNFNVSVVSGATGYVAVSRADGSGTSDPAQLLLLSNLDLDRPLPSALKIQSAGGGITTAVDLTDASIGTAVSVGANDITGTTGNIAYTNFGVNGSTGNVTSGLVNGQTISSAANFTGTVGVAGNLTLTSDVAVNGGDVTSTGALNITPSGTLTAGSTTQQLILQGNASTTLTATGGGSTTTIGFTGTPTGTVTYNFDRAATAGTYTICTTVGNCAGVGGGVTTGGGTIGTLPVFSGTQAIGDSLVSQSGGVVTVNGNLNLTTGHQFAINGTQISSGALSNDNDLAKLSSSETFTGNAVAFKNAVNSTSAFSVQNTAGTKALAIDTTSGQVLLGTGSVLDGKLVFSNISNTHTVTINPGTPTVDRTLTLPNASGVICTDSGNCAGAGATLQTGYNFSTGGTTPKVKLNSTLLGVDIQDADTTIAADLFDVRASNAVGLGSVMFGVGNTGQITLQNSSNSTTAFRLLTAAGTAVVTSDTTNGQLLLGQSGTLGGTLVFRNATNTNTLTLVGATTTSNQTITLPNSTGTVCLNSGNCSGAGSSNTLQAAYDAGNSVTTTDSRDLAFTLADTTTDANFLVNLQCVTSCASNGRFAVQSGGTDVFTVAPAGGAVTLRTTSNSTTALQLQRADGTALLTADSTNTRVGIGKTSPGYTLDVNGDANISTGSAYRINGASICTSSGCTAASGSGFYIQNSTSPQTSSNFNISGTGTASTFTASLYDSSTTTLNLATGSATATSILFGHSASFATGADQTLSIQTAASGSNGNNLTLAAGSGNGTSKNGGNLVLQGGAATSGGTGGSVIVKPQTNSVNAFQAQTSGGTDVLNVDTTNSRVGVGSSSNAPTRTLDVSTSDASTNSLSLLVSQAGAGDSGIEVKNTSENYYVGVDSSDNNAFKINSATSAAGKLLGNDSIGPAVDIGGDRGAMNVTQFTASATGTITTLYAYIASPIDSSPNNQGQMAIYSDSAGSPGTKLASSSSVTVAGNAWTAFAISSTNITSGTKYWLAYNTNATLIADNDLAVNWNGGSSGYKTQTFGTWPTTFGTPTATYTGTYSMYALVTTTGPSDEFLNTIFKLSRSGALTLQNVSDSASAFQILGSSGAGSIPIFTVDTTGGYAYLKGTGSNYGGGTLYFGDSTNVSVGEDGFGADSDTLELYGSLGAAIDTGGGTGLYVNGSASVGLRTSSVIAGYTVANGGLVVRDADSATKAYRFRTSGGALDFEGGGSLMYLSNWTNADFTGTQYIGMILYNTQSRIDIKSSYTYFTPTTSPAGDLVDFNRTTAGTLLGFALNGTIQGSISVSGTTVSYNAFTGSHYGWSEGPIDRGKVVSMTGNNKHKNPNDSGDEPIYGVKVATQANDPAVLGSYLGIMNPELPESLTNPEQIMSVGNGDMWVDDEAGDIQPGDFLISAANAGYAMKDNGQFAESNVIARASDRVEWSNETKMVNGHKVRKISVLFSAFTRLNATGLSQGTWSGGLVAMDTTFNALATFNKNVVFNGDADFKGKTTFEGNVDFRDNTAGVVKISAGQKTLTVTFSHPHDHIPIVNVTPGEFVSGSYRVRDVAKDRFVIELSQAQDSDITFNWSALATSGQN